MQVASGDLQPRKALSVAPSGSASTISRISVPLGVSSSTPDSKRGRAMETHPFAPLLHPRPCRDMPTPSNPTRKQRRPQLFPCSHLYLQSQVHCTALQRPQTVQSPPGPSSPSPQPAGRPTQDPPNRGPAQVIPSRTPVLPALASPRDSGRSIKGIKASASPP